MSAEFQCAPWCVDGDGHPHYVLRGDQSCWGPEHRVVFGLERGAPGTAIDPDPFDAPGVRVYPYQGWYELPKVKLNVYSDAADIDYDFLLTPFEAVELANHLISVVETIGGAR